ncbi:MAG: hypothetical protein QXJ23_10710, partial [Thermofilum sp.]|uniref:hypothetical protein n=1 Tax=Thermofilum sp. TaxID=1961369 RepID=UPI003179B138
VVTVASNVIVSLDVDVFGGTSYVYVATPDEFVVAVPMVVPVVTSTNVTVYPETSDRPLRVAVSVILPPAFGNDVGLTERLKLPVAAATVTCTGVELIIAFV